MARRAHMSEREARAFASRQRREAEANARKLLRKKDRERLAALRESIKAARAQRRARIKEARDLCRRGRELARQRVIELRAKLRAAIQAERDSARGACVAGVDRARELGAKGIEGARGALKGEQVRRAAERESARLTREIEGRAKKSKRAALTSSERRAESDGEVERNLPDELIGLWRKVKRSIHASARRSRTEAFLEWVAEHPEKYAEHTRADEVRHLRELEREEREHARAMRSESRYRSAASVAAALDDARGW